MRAILLALPLILLTSACKKETPEPLPTPEPGVVEWTPAFTYTRSGQNFGHNEPAWSFTSESTVRESNGVEYHHGLQEAVITNTADTTVQWRIGFVGTFITPGGALPTPTAMGAMASVNSHFFGRFLWNDTDSLFVVTDGVRVQHRDAAGDVWSSDRVPGTNGGNFVVTEAVATGFSSGTARQVKINFSCAMRNDAGQSFSVVNASYQGPIVVL
jgi:hypothetical protein